jgi:hypothetical protein
MNLSASSRTGVMKAMIDRAASLRVLGKEVVEVCPPPGFLRVLMLMLLKAVYSAFGLKSVEERINLVPCALALLSLEVSPPTIVYEFIKD